MNDKPDHILAVQNLGNYYEDTPLLQNISFSLKQGEILCLLGPSGSGKTTLLRLIAGLEKHASGTITFHGGDIANIPPHKRNFGMMFQEYALFPHKNVYQNIAFGLEMQQCPAEQVRQKVEAMLDLVGLKGLGHRRIDELSGGERQRVALARSLAPEPQLLLLDEPLGSLDRTLRDRLTIEIRTILKKLAVTAIFVTHDQAEAFSVADKVAVLHNGILQQFDRPEDLYRQPKNTTVATFLGFTNFIETNLDAAAACQSPLGRLTFLEVEKLPRAKVTILIRPDGARIVEPSATSSNNSGPMLSGTVTNRIFQGGSYRLTLQNADAAFTFDLPIDPPPPPIGDTIHLAVNPAAIVLVDNQPTDDL